MSMQYTSKYVRNYLAVCMVGNALTVKLAQCFFCFTHRLYVPFRTYKWQNITHCIQKRCKLTVVVLLSTGATDVQYWGHLSLLQ